MNVRREGDVFVAEENGEVVGSARPDADGGLVLELREPREGIALALLRAAVAERPGEVIADGLPSFGSVHLQTDDQGEVAKLVERLVPRVLASRETVVAPPRNGWIAVYDAVADSDPRKLGALGRELSGASGLVTITIGVESARLVHLIALERGRLLDEYVSVPSLRAAASGDQVALRANPTVLARLTGANPARIRSVARTADSPDELPAADELIIELAAALGLEGAYHGFEGAADLPGAVRVEHA
jgi:hypothetical protein